MRHLRFRLLLALGSPLLSPVAIAQETAGDQRGGVVLEESPSPSPPEDLPTEADDEVQLEETKSEGERKAKPPEKTTATSQGEAVPEANADATPLAVVGIDPSLPQFDEGGVVAPAQSQLPKDGSAGFQFHGFLRAPFRLGLGPKNDGTEGTEPHSPPRIADGSFSDWRYTQNMPGPWAQLLLSYGTRNVMVTAGIATFNFTNASYRDLQSQLGINEGFVTLNYPDALGRYGGLILNVGAFSGRYGTAGKSNAGRYNTYLFGRTRVMGETLTAVLHLSPSTSITLEHGVGAKADVVPFETVVPRPEYLPYPGPEPQGTTWVHHAHALAQFHKKFELGLHFLESRSPDDRRDPALPANPGRMSIFGGDARLNAGAWGDAYLGYSHIDAEEILSLSDAIEVLHSFQGWNFRNNYFGRFDPQSGITQAGAPSGQVDSVLFQYDLSLGKVARLPARFSGNGPDLTVSLFGMFNHVTHETNSHDKMKFGFEGIYMPFAVAGVGLRYDLVQEDLRDDDRSFAMLSPSLQLRTEFVTQERVTIQYSRYFLGSQAYPAPPFFQTVRNADPDALLISARMWW